MNIEILKKINEHLNNSKEINLKDFNKEDTAIIVVDMVNGFIFEGPLSSNRVEAIIEETDRILKESRGFKKVFFKDEHKEDAVEFLSYPKHCVYETSESEIIDALKAHLDDENTVVAPKNSTNGFHAPLFKKWLKENENRIKNYIVLGCCTDICVSQFAITLKTYFNEENLNNQVVIPINGVETYDFDIHNGDLMNLFALYSMKSNGIEIVKEIK